MIRVLLFITGVTCITGMLAWWHFSLGFDLTRPDHWFWLKSWLKEQKTLPPQILTSLYVTGGVLITLLTVITIIASRTGSKTILGGHNQDTLHGSARWARLKEIKKAGLVTWFGKELKKGVVVGGFKKKTRTVVLRHDGPEHVLAFAPTRSGKGVGLVLPTLLTWQHSAIVLDIKGENFALTAGWRESIGQRILKFEPASETGSVRFNPLSEIRTGTNSEIADTQNIAMMIIDPDGKGLKDFWMQSGFEWLTGAILHVLYRIQKEEGRTASLKDVNTYMSGVTNATGGIVAEDVFDNLLDDMIEFDHGRETVDAEVRRCALKMKARAGPERSGVHSSSTTQLALYADPIVSANISGSDFKLDDLMNGDQPTTLYIVIPPSDIDRLRPLIRVVMNLFLRRLTSDMSFRDGSPIQSYKHRMLLMLDEFTSIGKLEIFESALAYMSGYRRIKTHPKYIINMYGGRAKKDQDSLAVPYQHGKTS